MLELRIANSKSKDTKLESTGPLLLPTGEWAVQPF
jgi:hypothetical protein